ncbi:alpha/beta fold hydrolase [Actinocatenispora rupis]|uniref:Esterase n=1 Tax=Actinocatenispora rupis TaxID=519421 RepID=A0A8J3NB86_9ACTN|nr:alpha/beta hydrolase [Actinocatenispora rupis]GID10520.1 esterase [Actinocatenispora rupis]
MTHRIGTGEHHVIALHGWLGPAESWSPVWPHLDTATFSYAFPDYRGYGTRRDEAGAYTVDEIAADVLALADELGWDTFSLVGHSMGGKAVQRVYALAPERVRALVGVCPVPASGVPFDEPTEALFTGAAADPANRRAIIDFTTGGRLTGTWLDAMVARSVATSTPEAFAGYLRSWAYEDFHADIAGADVPVKVIVGEHDPALSADVMRATFQQWYPKAELTVLANAGHYPMDETPLALTTETERFLA